MEKRSLYVDKKQRNLLLESEVTKEFPFLLNILNKNDKVTHEIVATLSDEEKNFFNNTLPQVIKQAQSEWVNYGDCHDLGEVSTQCTICETPNRYLYYITNLRSGKSINVGSECIKKFFDDITNKIGRSGFDSYHRQQVKQARKLRRLHEFNQVFPGAERTLTSWMDELNSLPFMIPADLEKEYKNNYYIARELIKDFQNRKNNDEIIFKEFESVVNRREIIWAKINEFITQIKDNKFAVNKEILNWLNIYRKNTVLGHLKTKCLIDLSTFSEIWEPNFINKLTNYINKLLNRTVFYIIKVDHSNLRYIIQYKGNINLELEISYRNLAIIIGPYIFRTPDSPISHDRLLDDCSLNGSRSYDTFIEALRPYYKKHGINLHSYYQDFNEIILVDQRERKYKVINLGAFIKNHMIILYKNKIKDVDQIVKDTIKDNGNAWYNQEDLNDFIEQRRNL